MKRKSRKTEGDMTSMIDCVFLLLIFFIIAAKFITPEGHLDIWMPKDSGQSNARPVEQEELLDTRIYVRGGPNYRTAEDKRFRLYLDQQKYGSFDPNYVKGKGKAKDDPRYALYTSETKKIRAAFRELTAELKGMIDAGTKPAVTIDIDPDVPYLFVVEAMNACTQMNLKEGVKFAAQKTRLTKMHDGKIVIDNDDDE